MTPLTKLIKENEKKEILDSEFAIFFSEIEKNLPNTIEMAQLGKSRIATAVYSAYTIFKPVLIKKYNIALLEEVHKWCNENVSRNDGTIDFADISLVLSSTLKELK